MITCNRCGSISPASAMSCQNCGAPLSSKAETGLGSSRGFQEQPELPAWLGSLRAGERPAAPADNPSNFSTADLIEEGSLPSWMRSGRPEMNDTGMSSPYLPLRPSSAPGPNTDDSRGINAKSLIDEQSLPSWMQESKPPTGPIPEGGIVASSLLQQDLMPDWMKSLQQNSPLPDPASLSARPMPSPSPSLPVAPAPMADRTNEMSSRPSQGFSARDLVDQQSLPSWMKQQEGKGPVPVPPGASGALLSPSSLVDQQSLPPWLQESTRQEQRSGSLPPVQANPPWQSPMQGGGAMQQPSFGPAAPFPMQQQGSPVWQSASPQIPPTPGMNNASVQGEGLSASSFIDPNALPQWLRSATEQQNQPGSAMYSQRPAATPRSGYSISPRVENVRVPSRPRGEINPNESNEAAANVFASMLGVASATPNFPGAPPAQGYGMQGGSFGQGLPASQLSSMQGTPSASNIPGQVTGAPPGFNNPQGMQGPQAQGYASGGFNSGIYQAGNQGQGNYPAGNSFPGASQYLAGGSGTGNLGMGTDGGQKTSTKPAKKGLLDMIRDWFR